MFDFQAAALASHATTDVTSKVVNEMPATIHSKGLLGITRDTRVTRVLGIGGLLGIPGY